MGYQHGLNRAHREIIAQQVLNGASGEYVRGQIESMSASNSSNEWNYDANVTFASWLSRQGYVETARYLERRINGKT